MTTARDIMAPQATCAGEEDTLNDAARIMRDLDVGALPICGTDEQLKGIITDRDIVIRCLADGGDPSSVTVGSLAQGKPVTIGADDTLEDVIATMAEHQVRRLPVIDGHKLVGIISEADLAAVADDAELVDAVGAILEP